MDWILTVHSLQRSERSSCRLRLPMLAAAQGCPTVDSCVDARPFSRPRVPFLPGSVLHGSDSVGDEYAAVNSLCYSDVFDDDIPHKGEAPVHSFSQQRVPVSDSCTQEGTKTDQSQKENALGIAPRISNASAASMWTTRSLARPLDDELRCFMGDLGLQARKALACRPFCVVTPTVV